MTPQEIRDNAGRLSQSAKDYTAQGRQAVDTIFDKRATWILVAVVAVISFTLGAWLL